MTELQKHEDLPHPELHRASNIAVGVAVGVGVFATAVLIAEWLGGIGRAPWISPLLSGAVLCFAFAHSLTLLTKVRRNSLTRHLRRALALILPALLTFLDPEDFPTRVALAAFFVIGVAFTLDTQAGFPAWSRNRWLATGGSLGFALFCAGALLPSYILLLVSWPLLMMALGTALRLAELDAIARDEDGAVRAVSPP